MGKIKKAFEALQNARDTESGDKRDLTLGEGRRSSGSARGSAREPSMVVGAQLGEAKPGMAIAVENLIPRHVIQLDTKVLEAAGLMPSDEDISVISQQFRQIKRPLLQCAFGQDLPIGENANVIMMASALPGSGKSFCSFNLVQSIAIERDYNAVLVDADVLKPSISRDLQLEGHVGLIDYLVNPEIELADILVQIDLNGILVIPAGRRHPEATELLASRRMRELVAELSMTFGNRVIVFDTPPMLATSEAQVLAGMMGQIVLVIEARVSSQESVKRTLELLDREKPINAILNKSRSAAGGGYQHEGYGYYPYPKGNTDE